MIFGDSSPIIACATGGFTTCAVHLIRLSGFENIDVFKCFSLDSKNIKPRYAHLTKLLDSEEVFDEVLLTYFNAPNSYNGENILELSVHGNPLNVQRIIKFFKDNYGFRDAYGGEFSYRALKNKKITLSQVEGLDLFLNAQSIYALNQGFSLLAGDFQTSFKKLFDDYIRYKASIELMIDFAEDVGDEAIELLKSNFRKLLNQIEILHKLLINNSGSILKPEVVILGEPNAGKSTFFNKILKKNRAIVSEIAGTTRDYLSENWVINGNVFSLIDTAGLRNVTESIEKEGIEKAKNMIDSAFFKILITQDTENKNEFDFKIISHQNNFEKENDNTFKANLLDDTDNLIQNLEDLIDGKFKSITANNPILLDRQKEVISQIHIKMNEYKVLLEQTEDIAILDSELQLIGQDISELIGVINPESVLQHIFSNFCIGK